MTFGPLYIYCHDAKPLVPLSQASCLAQKNSDFPQTVEFYCVDKLSKFQPPSCNGVAVHKGHPELNSTDKSVKISN